MDSKGSENFYISNTKRKSANDFFLIPLKEQNTTWKTFNIHREIRKIILENRKRKMQKYFFLFLRDSPVRLL